MEQKPWYMSTTIWGIVAAAASIFAPRYAPVIPQVVTDASTILSLVVASYGRLKASKQITIK